MVRVAGPDSHGFSYSRLGFCMFVFGFWAAWAYRIESFVDSVAISPCKFCVWPDFHGLRPSIPIAWLRATYTRAIWYSIAGPQTIVKLFAGCWKCPPHTFHVPDFSIYLGFPTSNQSFHLHYLNLRFDTILHIYIYVCIYIYICVCVYLCVGVHFFLNMYTSRTMQTLFNPSFWS